MISAPAFMLFNLALYVAILLGIGVVERRGRTLYRSRDRRVRYRRLSTEEALRRIRREALGVRDRTPSAPPRKSRQLKDGHEA